jgi:hypothetical protein
MFEINLLPWREQRRRRWHKFRMGLAVVGLLVLVVVLGIYMTSHAPETIIKTVQQPSVVTTTPQQQLQNFKYIGILQQGAKVWGVLFCADGTTLDVQTGRKIPGLQAWVSRISATELVIRLAHQQQYVLKMEDASR